MGKRYYWLKLPEGFFRQKQIKKLRKIAGGDTYTIIYLKMLLLAMKEDGKIYFEGVEDDFYEELALELDEDSENVKVTVLFLLRQGLMELIDESAYLLTECDKMVGSESASAERVRRHRDKKALQCNTDVTEVKRLSNVEIEKEIEKDKEKDIKSFCPEPGSSEPYPKVETEPDTVSGPKVEIEPVQIFIELPLNNNTQFAVSEEYVKQLKELYPAVDVEQALRNMKGWLIANPSNRKTPRGIKRFINGWIAREQDRGPRRAVQEQQRRPAGNSGNRFNNFHQRQYDMGQLERELLERGKK